LASCSFGHGGQNSGFSVPQSAQKSSNQAVPPIVHGGVFRLSSSKSGHAIAAHMPSGDFLGSVAIGPSAARFTYAGGGKRYFSLVNRVRPGWHHLPGGMKFSQRVSRGGKIAILGRAKTGLKFLLNVRSNGYVTLRMHRIGSMNFEYYAHTNNATFASYHDALNSLIDNPGTWTGDDDFAGVLAHPPNPTPRTQRESNKHRHHQTSSPGTEPKKRLDAGDAGDAGPADCDCDPGDTADSGDPYDQDPSDTNDPTDVGDTSDTYFMTMKRTRTLTARRTEQIESVSADQQAYMRCLVTACLVAPGDIAPVALVLAKATYRPIALQK
jgi:hypothetical protein